LLFHAQPSSSTLKLVIGHHLLTHINRSISRMIPSLLSAMAPRVTARVLTPAIRV
jgi:hypothetical protein